MERAAGRYLRRRGLRLITRNFLTKRGEIDLVMRDGATLVFVEVRYRSSTARMQPYESVGHRKRQRLLAAGRIFVGRHGELGPIRFDVVSVTRQNYHLRFDWIRGAFPD
jgi:putative endonuclease